MTTTELPYHDIPLPRCPLTGSDGPRTRGVMRTRDLYMSRSYLARDTDDGILLSEPLADHDDEHMGWDKLRRVCRQLGVDLRDLGVPGLHLG